MCLKMYECTGRAYENAVRSGPLHGRSMIFSVLKQPGERIPTASPGPHNRLNSAPAAPQGVPAAARARPPGSGHSKGKHSSVLIVNRESSQGGNEHKRAFYNRQRSLERGPSFIEGSLVMPRSVAACNQACPRQTWQPVGSAFHPRPRAGKGIL